MSDLSLKLDSTKLSTNQAKSTSSSKDCSVEPQSAREVANGRVSASTAQSENRVSVSGAWSRTKYRAMRIFAVFIALGCVIAAALFAYNYAKPHRSSNEAADVGDHAITPFANTVPDNGFRPGQPMVCGTDVHWKDCAKFPYALFRALLSNDPTGPTVECPEGYVRGLKNVNPQPETVDLCRCQCVAGSK